MDSLTQPPPMNQGTIPEPYLRGGLRLGNTYVPYFSTSMLVRNAASSIDLPFDLPVNDEVPITLDELFQRELDKERVEAEIVNYLKRRDDLHFFNSLTVVIFPLEDEGGTKVVAERYGKANRHTPGQHPQGYKRVEIGPVLLLESENNPTYGLISWNQEFARAVVLDGQHRLYAMKHALGESTPTAKELVDSRISVLFLVLDERAGFKPADHGGSSKTLFSISRQIFTDLNQKAVSVPKVRLLLLADEDLVATSLRAILAENVRVAEDTPIEDRVEKTGRLPLGLVDWRSESARFDTSSYLTSVLALRPVVDKVLGLDLPPVGADTSQVRRFLSRAEQRLRLSKVEGLNIQLIEERITECEEYERPFEFRPEEIRMMAAQFRELYGRRIVQPLTRLEPYGEFIAALESAGIFSSQREAWLSYDSATRTALESDLEKRGLRLPKPILEEEVPKVKDRNLAFQVVFQQASMMVVNDLADFAPAIGPEWNVVGSDEDAFIGEIIRRWNIVFPNALRISGRESPFFGAGVRADGTIDYRKSRVNSITGFMVYGLLSPLEWYAGEPPTDDEITKWIGNSWEEIRRGTKADAMKSLLSQHGSAWRTSVKELLRAQDKDSDDQLETLKHARGQMRRLIDSTQQNPT